MITSEMEELKKCPFCGLLGYYETEEREDGEDSDCLWYFIACSSGCMSRTDGYESPHRASEMWNERSSVDNADWVSEIQKTQKECDAYIALSQTLIRLMELHGVGLYDPVHVNNGRLTDGLWRK